MWYNQFKEGPEDVNDDISSVRPSTSTTDENFEAVKMILDNRRITIREITDDVGPCQAFFTDVLIIKRAAPKIVPNLLSSNPKRNMKKYFF